jgi:hypothetical protein
MSLSLSSTTVLGKRRATRYVLHISASPQPEPSTSTADLAVYDTPEPPSKKARHPCTYSGCTKSYSKACRLAEHIRSHTGEVRGLVRRFTPTVLISSNSVPTSARLAKNLIYANPIFKHMQKAIFLSQNALMCVQNQQPARNGSGPSSTSRCTRIRTAGLNLMLCVISQISKPFALISSSQCTVEDCDEVFAKHHQLRSHTCQAHAPPGTKPYMCTHPGCARSFDTNQKLRGHVRTHDGSCIT